MSLQGLYTGDYQLQHLVESDGVVEIYLAFSLSKKQQASIKVIRTDLASHDAQLNVATQRLLNEAVALGKLNHPHILPLTGFGWIQFNHVALPCIIISDDQGKNLTQWLQEQGTSNLIPDEVAHIVHQAADALEYAHQQSILHRRVAPVNVIIRDNPNNAHYPHLLLTNFDLSVSPSVIDISQQVRGIPAYIAPEQWKGEHVPASDQYALAVLAYELLTGRPPFEGEARFLMQQHLTAEPPSPSTFNPELTPDIDFVLLHALAKTPQKRFASIAAFDRALQSAIRETQMVSNNLKVAQVKQPTTSISNEQTLSPHDVDNMIGAKIAIAQQVQEVNQSRLYEKPLSPPKRLSPITILLVALAVCVIVGSSLVYYGAIDQPGQLYARSTATALAPTFTAQAAITAQAQATATFTTFQNNFDQLTASSPTYSDPMTAPSSVVWDQGSSPLGSCNYTNKGYYIRINKKSSILSCFARDTNFSNFVYQDQLKMNQEGFSYFLFRVNLQKQIGYILTLFANGIYSLGVYTGPNIRLETLIQGITIPIASDQTYQVAVIARGNSFDIYINGSYVNSTRDKGTTSSTGIIGLGAGTSVNDESTSIYYSQVQVWQL